MRPDGGAASGKRRRTLVLDSGAISAGKPLDHEGVLYAPPAVVDEFQPGGRSRRALDYLLEAGLRVIPPTPAALGEVEEAASRTGDLPKLSGADLEVLALARDVQGIVVTDDYAVQNVAARLNLPFEAILQPGITEQITWSYKCRGCGKQYATLAKECAVCGSEVRAVKGK
ncbi:MAG: DNA-binding protein [Halobacteriales archaeon]|nr:DNA-binding protein [Halobacteriales archaeon]